MYVVGMRPFPSSMTLTGPPGGRPPGPIIDEEDIYIWRSWPTASTQVQRPIRLKVCISCQCRIPRRPPVWEMIVPIMAPISTPTILKSAPHEDRHGEPPDVVL